MVLALNYMQKTGNPNAALQAKAKRFVDQGYQRLLTFESKTKPGGFALWTGGAPTVFLTAYGLMQFTDMRSVTKVSPKLLTRMKAFLRKQQAEDGSFSAGNLTHSWGSWKETPFYMTAYVAWALARAGEDTSKALAYLDKHAESVDDPYGLALAGLAFAAADPTGTRTQVWVGRVAAKGRASEAGIAWSPTTETFVGGRGPAGEIETTAMAAILMLTTNTHTSLGHRAVDRLIAHRRADGRFGSTHSTALALRALIAASGGGDNLPATSVTFLTKGGEPKQVVIPKGSTEPVRVALGTLDPSRLSVRLDAEGRVRGTLSRTTYEPWDTTVVPKGPLALAATWAEGALEVDQEAVATVTVRNTGQKKAKVVTVELGLPPGITVKPEKVTGPGLEEAERAERTLVLYLSDMAPGESRTFSVPFRVRHAFEARTAPSRVYEYYVEHEATVLPPILLRAR